MSEEFKRVKRKAEDALYKSETALGNMSFGRFAERLKELERGAAEVIFSQTFSGAGAATRVLKKEAGRIKIYCRCDDPSALKVTAGGATIALVGGVYAGGLPSLDNAGSYVIAMEATKACNAVLIFRGAGAVESV